jgi:hypothetical protein
MSYPRRYSSVGYFERHAPALRQDIEEVGVVYQAAGDVSHRPSTAQQQKYQSPRWNSQCIGNEMSRGKLFLAKLLSMEQPVEWATN